MAVFGVCLKSKKRNLDVKSMCVVFECLAHHRRHTTTQAPTLATIIPAIVEVMDRLPRILQQQIKTLSITCVHIGVQSTIAGETDRCNHHQRNKFLDDVRPEKHDQLEEAKELWIGLVAVVMLPIHRDFYEICNLICIISTLNFILNKLFTKLC